MNLPPQETERFYRIWMPLLKLVSERRHLAPGLFDSLHPKIPVDIAGKLRNALWEDDALLQAFIDENPAGLVEEDLRLAATWLHRVSGRFFILRHLKKYSVFLDEGSPPRVYGVLGLVSPIPEIIGPEVPLLVETVLLPFEDKIIYDSILAPYSIHFGPGIREDLNLTYRDAQEREGIITSLGSADESVDPQAKSQLIQERSAKLVGAFRKGLFKTGLSPKMVEQHAGNIERLGENLARQTPPLLLLDITAGVVENYLASFNAAGRKPQATSLKRFVRFLYDTMRLDPETAWEIKTALHRYEPAGGRRAPRRGSRVIE